MAEEGRKFMEKAYKYKEEMDKQGERPDQSKA